MSDVKPTFIHTWKVDSFLSRITPYFPFSYLWIYKRSLDDEGTILDIGCGDGVLMKRISKGKNRSVWGIDIFSKSLVEADNKRVYKKLIKGDVVKICGRLVKQKMKFDCVFCSQVIEHITKDEGNKLLDLVEKLARHRIVFATPIGYMNQPEVFIGNNPYQYHKSGWSVDEFRRLGYKVYGMGFKPGWSEEGLSRGKNAIVVVFSVATSYLFSPIVYFFPQFAAGMICVKEI